MRLNRILVAACCLGAVAAQAQSAGQWALRAAVVEIAPRVSSGDLSPPSLADSQASVGSDTQPGGGITYFYTDHFSVDLPLALPFKHNISGAGAVVGAGKIGTVKAMPITVLGQYRFFDAQAAWRPYVGAGLTYAKFYDATSTASLSAITGGGAGDPTTLSVQSKWAATVQIGITHAINQRWFIDLNVGQTFLKTTTLLSSGQTLPIRLDPASYSLGVGMRF